MRIGIIGSRGQLGNDLYNAYESNVLTFNRPFFDVLNQETWGALLESPIDILINTSAYNEVDKAESDIESCFLLNTLAPGRLARFCHIHGIVFVTISTDYVFGLPSSNSLHPYTESDPTNPLSVYGISKRAGESLVLNSCPSSYVIRTCGLYGEASIGKSKGSFVETMLRLSKKGIPISVVSDQIVAPTPTKDLSIAIKAALDKRIPYGLYHMTSGGACSWYEFTLKVFELARVKAIVNQTTMDAYGSAAKRSPYSILSNEKLSSFGIFLPSWDEGLRVYLASRKME